MLGSLNPSQTHVALNTSLCYQGVMQLWEQVRCLNIKVQVPWTPTQSEPVSLHLGRYTHQTKVCCPPSIIPWCRNVVRKFDSFHVCILECSALPDSLSLRQSSISGLWYSSLVLKCFWLLWPCYVPGKSCFFGFFFFHALSSVLVKATPSFPIYITVEVFHWIRKKNINYSRNQWER